MKCRELDGCQSKQLFLIEERDGADGCMGKKKVENSAEEGGPVVKYPVYTS